MKTLFLILLLAPLFGLSQKRYNWETPVVRMDDNQPPTNSVFYFWNQYLADCNELVSDTIKQSGVVNVKYKPVIVNGEISHYILSPVDTVWTDCNCGKYKENDSDIWTIRTTDSIGSRWYVDHGALTGLTTYTEAVQADNKINITRNKICHIKKRKASWDDFWNRWLVENKIIELK